MPNLTQVLLDRIDLKPEFIKFLILANFSFRQPGNESVLRLQNVIESQSKALLKHLLGPKYKKITSNFTIYRNLKLLNPESDFGKLKKERTAEFEKYLLKERVLYISKQELKKLKKAKSAQISFFFEFLSGMQVGVNPNIPGLQETPKLQNLMITGTSRSLYLLYDPFM